MVPVHNKVICLIWRDALRSLSDNLLAAGNWDLDSYLPIIIAVVSAGISSNTSSRAGPSDTTATNVSKLNGQKSYYEVKETSHTTVPKREWFRRYSMSQLSS